MSWNAGWRRTWVDDAAAGARSASLIGVRRIVLHAAVAGAAVLLAGCARTDPERELRTTIDKMAGAIASRNAADFLDGIAEDFESGDRQMRRDDVKRLLATTLLPDVTIRVVTVISALRIQGERASVELRVVSTKGDSWAPERSRTWDVTSGWRREGGKWRVIAAQWQEGL